MGGWLVRHFTVFGIPGQNWMLVEFAIILVSVIIWWSHR
jgi:hypothetical protein